MNKTPLVTVLMLVYNGERFLRKAMESILSQTYKDFEFLIINDGSTDGSRKIILSYNDPRIRFIEHQQNLGIPRSRNMGLRLARGKYIACMDADDISLPPRLEKQVKFLADNPDTDIVASWIEKVDEDGGHLGFWGADRKNDAPEEIYYTLHFKNCIAHSSVLFKKELVCNAGGYNEDFVICEDYELWIRLSKIAKMAKIKQIMVKWREHSTNTLRNANREHHLNEEKLYLGNFPEFLLDNKKKEILLFIKDPGRKTKPANLGDMLKIFDQMSNKIILEADPNLLSIKKLERYCRIRRNHFIFNSIKRSLFSKDRHC